MALNNREELYNISSQMIDIFVQDIFSKNNEELAKIKKNISEEQRESLRKSVNDLKKQVDEFVFEQKASKTVTENDESDTESDLSPLKEMLLKRNKSK